MPPISLTRRRLLASVLGSSVALALQGCGPKEVAPTPAPTRQTWSRFPSSTPGTPLPASPAPTTIATTVAPSVTATSGPELLHLPVAAVQPTSTPTQTPTPTSTPTDTATVPPATRPPQPAGPSQTPRPTATPHPHATPFPPGLTTRLGLFVGYQHPKLLELLHTGNVPLVKTLEYDANLMEHIKKISPDTILVARYTPLKQLDLATMDPIAEARHFVNLLLPVATEPKRLANIDFWEAYNEPAVRTAEDMKRLAIFEAERVRLLGQAGVRSCIGNFATGEPALELWPEFFPALEVAKEYAGVLGLHEYSAPYLWFGSGPYQLQAGQDEGDEGWLTLRYRKVYRRYLQPNKVDIPLLITETGIDGQVRNRPGPSGLGWQDFAAFWEQEGRIRASAASFYMEQLAWYDAELLLDPYVGGAAIYALAAPTGWGSFDIIGECADLLQQYLAVHPRRY